MGTCQKLPKSHSVAASSLADSVAETSTPVGHWLFFRYRAAAVRSILMALEQNDVERSTRRPQAVEAASVVASTASRSASQVEVRSRSAGKHAAQAATAADCDRRLQRSQQLAGGPTASLVASASVVASAAAFVVDVRANAAAYAPRPSVATGNATSADAAAQAATEKETDSACGVVAYTSLTGSLARLPVSGTGSTSAADGEASARRRPGAVALPHAFPLSARVSYSRLCSTLVLLALWMHPAEAPDGSGRPCIGVLSEAPYRSGRPALPPYKRVEQHVVLEGVEQLAQMYARESKLLQADMHAHVHFACIYRLMSMYACLCVCVCSCLYMSAYIHMPMYFYRLYLSAYVHVYPSPRAKKRRKYIWHSKTTPIDPHPRGPRAWHTANWLALHARLTWMIAGPSGTND